MYLRAQFLPALFLFTSLFAETAFGQAQGKGQPQNPPPVAGVAVEPVGVTVTELVTVAQGYSTKKQILGKSVYNDKNEKVGKIEDVIVTPDKSLSYAIVGAGGYVGTGKYDVAIPVKQLKVDKDRFVLTGANKDSIKNLPKFEYMK